MGHQRHGNEPERQSQYFPLGLDWWLARASELEWTFAKTYSDTAPHSYVVEGPRGGCRRRTMCALVG
jgi:hypothetical protein